MYLKLPKRPDIKWYLTHGEGQYNSPLLFVGGIFQETMNSIKPYIGSDRFIHLIVLIISKCVYTVNQDIIHLKYL